MIVIFYMLYVWLTPANWQWIWFGIAILMQIYTLSRRQAVENAINAAIDKAEENNNHLGGPFA